MHSNISSIGYAEQIQNLANNTTWADQVEISKFQGFALSYATSKVRENNIANKVTVKDSIPELYNMDANNICNLQSLEFSAIPYSVHQPTDPQLWDSSFCFFFLFGINEYLEGNAKNIACSLYRMVAFIR